MTEHRGIVLAPSSAFKQTKGDLRKMLEDAFVNTAKLKIPKMGDATTMRRPATKQRKRSRFT